MTEESDMKFVEFDNYCSKCKYAKVFAFEHPCNECIETGARKGTGKPINFEEK